jgi:hypothetical protein
MVPRWPESNWRDSVAPIAVARLNRADYCGTTDVPYIIRRVGASHTKAGGAT